MECEIDKLKQKIKELEIGLLEAHMFASWVECLGRTDCEIYKHELKGSSDLAIERIEKVIDVDDVKQHLATK